MFAQAIQLIARAAEGPAWLARFIAVGSLSTAQALLEVLHLAGVAKDVRIVKRELVGALAAKAKKTRAEARKLIAEAAKAENEAVLPRRDEALKRLERRRLRAEASKIEAEASLLRARAQYIVDRGRVIKVEALTNEALDQKAVERAKLQLLKAIQAIRMKSGYVSLSSGQVRVLSESDLPKLLFELLEDPKDKKEA